MNKKRGTLDLTPIHLPYWTELVGEFRGVSVDHQFTYVKFGRKTLALRNDSLDKFVEQKLASIKIGSRIAFLATDLPEHPYLVRKIESRRWSKRMNDR